MLFGGTVPLNSFPKRGEGEGNLNCGYDLKNRDDLKNWDTLKKEDDLKSEDNLKNEDNLKIEDSIRNKKNLID